MLKLYLTLEIIKDNFFVIYLDLVLISIILDMLLRINLNSIP